MSDERTCIVCGRPLGDEEWMLIRDTGDAGHTACLILALELMIIESHGSMVEIVPPRPSSN